jgi:hypothetical protein
MSSLLTKFKDLCTKDIELPDSGTITTPQLNVQFQNKLYAIIRNIRDDHLITLSYLQYLNNYILDVCKIDTTTYRDKLYLIQHWKNEATDQSVTLDFNTIVNEPLITKLKNTDLTFKFKLPLLTYENIILKYILNKKEVVESDVLFFDTFRFIDTITLDTKEYTIRDMELDEIYDLFLLFDIKILNSLAKHTNSILGELNKLRVIEADFSFFVDL